MSQEPNGNCSDELLFWGGFYRVDFLPAGNRSDSAVQIRNGKNTIVTEIINGEGKTIN